MSERSKRILTLALNKNLQRQILDFKTTRLRENERDSDPEYFPSDESVSSSGDFRDSFIAEDPTETTQGNPVNYPAIPNSNDESTSLNDMLDMVELEPQVASTSGIEKVDDESVIKQLMNDILDKVEFVKGFTKGGRPRKRVRNEIAVSDRKKQRREKIVEMHNEVLPPCKPKCYLKCPEKLDLGRQQFINAEFWSLPNRDGQIQYVMNCVNRGAVKRPAVVENKISRRGSSYTYTLKNGEGEDVKVCKIFLLATLGYPPNNDRIIKTARNAISAGKISPHRDRRGRHPNSSKIDRTLINAHIMTFRPTISHYRREHAPNRLYLPSDISAKMMYEDFQIKYPEFPKFSCELYRLEVQKMNISFAELGNEECFTCETFKGHCKTTGHQNDQLDADCENCKDWERHHKKYEAARIEYQLDASRDKEETEIVVSTDLQKVIMLPRAEMFKEVIFIPRIIAFNESFVPLGKAHPKKRSKNPLAVLWHEAVSGRKKEDLISCFYAFFLHNRDCKKITLWLDNCASQNKNWALFCFFVYAVNCIELSLEKLEVKYFEAGHTFMSADHFHHQVELALQHKRKVYDFQDFVDTVKLSNSGKVDVIAMSISDFYDWGDFTSQYKLKKVEPRAYLNNMVQVMFVKGKNILQYKNNISDEYTELNFLTAHAHKNGIFKPGEPRKIMRGISYERKANLIEKLRPLLLNANRMAFWEGLPTGNSHEDDD